MTLRDFVDALSIVYPPTFEIYDPDTDSYPCIADDTGLLDREILAIRSGRRDSRCNIEIKLEGREPAYLKHLMNPHMASR